MWIVSGSAKGFRSMVMMDGVNSYGGGDEELLLYGGTLVDC